MKSVASIYIPAGGSPRFEYLPSSNLKDLSSECVKTIEELSKSEIMYIIDGGRLESSNISNKMKDWTGEVFEVSKKYYIYVCQSAKGVENIFLKKLFTNYNYPVRFSFDRDVFVVAYKELENENMTSSYQISLSPIDWLDVICNIYNETTIKTSYNQYSMIGGDTTTDTERRNTTDSDPPGASDYSDGAESEDVDILGDADIEVKVDIEQPASVQSVALAPSVPLRCQEYSKKGTRCKLKPSKDSPDGYVFCKKHLDIFHENPRRLSVNS
uniref:Uncharacterized protein n=1 Tax=viral metagenome TaxID=1070528 RepID=A0A6C0CM29_9ZZZZ